MPASATTTDKSLVQRARALFQEAGAFERQGQWGAAQECLRAALRIRETPHLHYALGWALENDDKLLDAKNEYEAAVRQGRDFPGGEEAVRLGTMRLAEIAKAVPVLRVRVVGAKPGTRVVVDGRDVKREADMATTPVNPGAHAVRVERDGEPRAEQLVYVGRGVIRTVSIDASGASWTVAHDRHGADSVSSASQGSEPTSTDDGSRVVPWLLLSGGLALIGGGTALFVSGAADSARHDALQSRWCSLTACTTSAPLTETSEAAGYRRAASDAASTGATKEVAGAVAGGIGVVAATAGVVMLLRGGKKSDETAPRAPALSASGAPLPGGGMATATFRF